MAAKRGKSQARRNGGSSNPPWLWLGIGLVLGVVLIVGVPKLMHGNADDGFFRPKPNPDARPVAAAGAQDDDAIVPEDAPPATQAAKPKPTTYDFYTMLPANEVELSDAELAETERAEAARAQAADDAATPPDAAKPAGAPTPVAVNAQQPAATTPARPADAAAKPKDDGAHYLLQAGAFQASGDAEAVKAKIALLGLSARVESAQIADKTVFRVRMGPYGSASELADAKRRLGTGGLPALAIKAR
jgi:cell division protein FtsN